jgi:hypothetical protein
MKSDWRGTIIEALAAVVLAFAAFFVGAVLVFEVIGPILVGRQ